MTMTTSFQSSKPKPTPIPSRRPPKDQADVVVMKLRSSGEWEEIEAASVERKKIHDYLLPTPSRDAFKFTFLFCDPFALINYQL
ncbi:unnamed protein product [Caenorhabditis sp. 36 PRJEB53466]|nr:unnamed protein product [Caenorhabditis sp. 36 PRJEB53466]